MPPLSNLLDLKLTCFSVSTNLGAAYLDLPSLFVLSEAFLGDFGYETVIKSPFNPPSSSSSTSDSEERTLVNTLLLMLISPLVKPTFFSFVAFKEENMWDLSTLILKVFFLGVDGSLSYFYTSDIIIVVAL